jgi:hypothetical protein
MLLGDCPPVPLLTASSLLRWWFFCMNMQKIPIIGAERTFGPACLWHECSLQGIKIHFREFLYDFARKRNKPLGAIFALFVELFPKVKFWESLSCTFYL